MALGREIEDGGRVGSTAQLARVTTRFTSAGLSPPGPGQGAAEPAHRGGSLVTTAHKEKASSHPAAAAIASIPTIRSLPSACGPPAGRRGGRGLISQYAGTLNGR
jgi:hypothetical protein